MFEQHSAFIKIFSFTSVLCSSCNMYNISISLWLWNKLISHQIIIRLALLPLHQDMLGICLILYISASQNYIKVAVEAAQRYRYSHTLHAELNYSGNVNRAEQNRTEVCHAVLNSTAQCKSILLSISLENFVSSFMFVSVFSIELRNCRVYLHVYINL